MKRTPIFGFAGLAALAFASTSALAADHAEAPLAGGDPAADIADFYAWHSGDTLTAIITYAPFIGAGGEAVYDADVMYAVHVDSDGDHEADHTVWIQTAANGAGDWGVRAIAGENQVEGPVGEVVEGSDIKLYAGLRDDPFFFDLAGFNDTLKTGTIAFTGTDAVAGANVMALVVEIPLDWVTDGGTGFQTWATTSRL